MNEPELKPIEVINQGQVLFGTCIPDPAEVTCCGLNSSMDGEAAPDPEAKGWGSNRSYATLSEQGMVIHYGMIRDEKIRRLMLERVLSLIAREECRLEQLKYDQPDEFDRLFDIPTKTMFAKTFY